LHRGERGGRRVKKFIIKIKNLSAHSAYSAVNNNLFGCGLSGLQEKYFALQAIFFCKKVEKYIDIAFEWGKPGT